MSVLTDFFTSLANKIRSKTGNSATMTPSEMIDAIDDIYTPTQTKTVTASTSATTVTPDTGYHLSSVTINPTPSQTKSATPSLSAQTISPDSGKLLSSVSVAAISPNRSSSSAVSGDKAWSYNSRMYFGIDYGWYPAATFGGMSNVSEKYITYASLARDIGLTAAKLLSGQSVLGITGTGATTHSGTYTFAANDTGGTKDLGTTHSYRYVNASNVYNKGKADAAGVAYVSATAIAANANKIVTVNLGYKPSFVAICDLQSSGVPSNSGRLCIWTSHMGTSYQQNYATDGLHAVGFSTSMFTQSTINQITSTGFTYSVGQYAVGKQVVIAGRF